MRYLLTYQAYFPRQKTASKQQCIIFVLHRSHPLINLRTNYYIRMGANQSATEAELDNYHEVEDYFAKKLTGTHSSFTNLFASAGECSLQTSENLSEEAAPPSKGLKREAPRDDAVFPKRSAETSFLKDSSTEIEEGSDIASYRQPRTILPLSEKKKRCEKNVLCIA